MTNLSNAHGPADHIQQFEQNRAAALEQTRIGATQPMSEDDEAEMLHTTDPTEMVREVERRRAAVSALLADTLDTFDKSTGKRALVLPEGHPRRRALEIELHNLTAHTLPLTQQRAAEIAARKAALPTTADRLQAEAERQQRIQQAAIKRAEEMEVEEAARRLRAQRNGVK